MVWQDFFNVILFIEVSALYKKLSFLFIIRRIVVVVYYEL